MPSGAKKRKALRKKQQQQQQGAIGGATTSTTTNHKGFNGDNNLHGNDEHGSQDGRGSDDSSSSSSPGGSQGNEEFGKKDSPAAVLSSSGMVKGAAKEISGDGDVTQGLGPKKSDNAVAVERGTDYQKSVVGNSTNSFSENRTHPAKHVASVTEITPVVESVKPVVVAPLSKAVTSEKSEHVDETSSLVKKKSEKNGECLPSPGLENNNSKVVVTLPRSAAETSKKLESVKKSEVPVSSEEKCLLLPGPPVVRRTSWLSCCGLFDAMTGSDR
ncbi:PREDICTED: E3 ubiquitin-protein ligase rnf213-beta-like [Camelina sativa]|uniref:E3 ubiquitin-protein ligase rnf213-beta-like n=1 Tax=Camelina sativa TaxID=90675 RepID=A0ABM0WZB0_CAMSA|nr:PREDICTED: E3 ubiquitin-protein ligase rnf213-beta-like [Camelina sativa]XP_010478323.1 PREDICTED: E3 ubiquitin-protein ligase rnf213-beta-like [Camelina sativa]